MKKSVNTKIKIKINNVTPLVFTALLIGLWQLAADTGKVPGFMLPSPVKVLKTFITAMPEMKRHIIVTLKEAFIGLAISIALSLVLAILMDSLKVVKKALYPLLLVSQMIPIIALAPLFVLWFGFGMLPKIIVVVLTCFFPIVISLLEGLNSVDTDMLNLLKAMGASKIQIFKLVKFPASMVSFFSGLRISTTYSIMGAVIAEWLGGTSGLGLYMINVKRSYAVDKVLAATLVIVILSMALFKVVEILQNLAMPWHKYMGGRDG